MHTIPIKPENYEEDGAPFHRIWRDEDLVKVGLW
jgi:hypothetical protein